MDNKLLEVKQLGKIYAGQQVLENITFSIEQAQIYGLVGENGAGKTTLIRILAELIKPTSGEIQKIKNLKMGLTVESPNLYDYLSAYDNLKYQALACGIQNVDDKILETLKLIGLDQVDRNKKVKDYSLGMKQRLAIGLTIIDSPTLIILDEPINGLDPVGIKDIRDILLTLKKQYNMTIFISSHILAELDLVADKFIIMHKGEIIEIIDSTALKKQLTASTIVDVDEIAECIKLLQAVGELSQIVNGVIEIKNARFSVNEIIDYLRKNDIHINGIYNKKATFEEHYLKLINK